MKDRLCKAQAIQSVKKVTNRQKAEI